MFDRARARPTLADVVAAARREELTRAGAMWSEAVADRGPAAARTGLAFLIDQEFMPDEHEHTPSPTEQWARRARRLVLHHGLEPAMARLTDLLAEWERERRPAGRTKP